MGRKVKKENMGRKIKKPLHLGRALTIFLYTTESYVPLREK